MRRTSALWLLLFAAYGATVGLDASDGSEYGRDELRYLNAVDSIGEDEVGFPLLIAPAHELAGSTGVELLMAAVAALAVALGYRLALRVVPDPWALGAALATGLSPPFVAGATAVLPDLTAGAALAGAALLAIRLDAHVGRRLAFGCFALLGLLPWLGPRYVPAGVVVGYVAARALWRSQRRTLAVGAVELSLFSVAFYVGINEALYGSPTPYPSQPERADAPSIPLWAPVLLLVPVGLWLLWHSHRERLARAVPALHEIELTAATCAAVLGAQVLAAPLLPPPAPGSWLSGGQVLAALPMAIPLVAWGLRRLPRIGTALAVLSVAASIIVLAL